MPDFVQSRLTTFFPPATSDGDAGGVPTRSSLEGRSDGRLPPAERTLYVLFDLESTGANVYRDRICQLAACTWDPAAPSERPACFEAYINPDYPMSLAAHNTHRIPPYKYANTQRFSLVLRQWQAWIAAHMQAREQLDAVVLCAHNGNGFDFRMLVAEMLRHGVLDSTSEPRFELPDARGCPVYVSDTLLAFRQLYPDLPSKALGALHEVLVGRPIDGAHNATADVTAMHAVLHCAQAEAEAAAAVADAERTTEPRHDAEEEADAEEATSSASHDAVHDVVHNIMHDVLHAELSRAATPFEACARVVDAALASKAVNLHPQFAFAPEGIPFADDGRYIYRDEPHKHWDVTTRRRYRPLPAAAAEAAHVRRWAACGASMRGSRLPARKIK
jgi:DNA polymerase III epsilon subunit-like protein